MRGDLVGLLAVAVGGAVPWLEAIVVIPPAILAGLDPAAVTAAALLGNLLTVALAAWAGDRLRARWLARRARRRTAHAELRPAPDRRPGVAAVPDGADAPARPSARPGAAGRRAARVLRRWGPAGLAVLGPVALGTQLSAVVAVAAGVGRRRAFAWVAAGTVGWALLATTATLGGVSLVGPGA